MKRTNVIVDEQLLEKARRASGEKTYSATINKALEALVRKEQFWAAYDRFEQLAHEGDFFWPGYAEEMRPKAPQKKARVAAAHEKRAPQKKAERRGSR